MISIVSCNDFGLVYYIIDFNVFQNLHGRLFDNHATISIDKYKAMAKDKVTRTCTDHKDQPYNGGCTVCLTLVCANCMFSPGTCADGEFVVFDPTWLY